MRLNGFERSGIVLVSAWIVYFGYLFTDRSDPQSIAFAQTLTHDGITLAGAKMVILALLAIASLLFLILYLIALKRFDEILQLYTHYEMLRRSDPASPTLDELKRECEALKQSGLGRLAGFIGKLPECKE